MDTRVKIIASAGILLGGLLLALLFRHPAIQPELAQTASDSRLVLRQHADPAAPAAQPSGERPSPTAAAVEPVVQPPRLLKPAERGTAPPELAKSFSAASPSGTSRWGISLGQVLPESGRSGQATLKHKIVDGDTLPALAERYLGSADRAMEIFEANRDTLGHPQVLPIGAELRIPPRDSPVAVVPPNPASQSMVPVPRGR